MNIKSENNHREKLTIIDIQLFIVKNNLKIIANNR